MARNVINLPVIALSEAAQVFFRVGPLVGDAEVPVFGAASGGAALTQPILSGADGGYSVYFGEYDGDVWIHYGSNTPFNTSVTRTALNTDLAIIPRTDEEVTAALALLPSGSFLLSSVITVAPFVDPPVIDSTSLGTVITVSVDSSGQDSVNLYYSDTSPVTTGDTKLTGITSPVDVTALVKGGRYYFAATGVIGAVEGALTAEVEGDTNEITDTEVFDGALWTVSNLTVSNNQITAPDGSLTGALITDASVAEAGSCGQQFALVTGDELQERTGSCYYKWDGVSAEAMLEFYYLTGGTLIFERVIISWNAGTPTVDNGTLEGAGDGWYRVGVSLTNNNSGNTFCLLRVYATENVKPDTGSVYVWGAQVVKGSAAGEYTVREAL